MHGGWLCFGDIIGCLKKVNKMGKLFFVHCFSSRGSNMDFFMHKIGEYNVQRYSSIFTSGLDPQLHQSALLLHMYHHGSLIAQILPQRRVEFHQICPMLTPTKCLIFSMVSLYQSLFWLSLIPSISPSD